MLNILDLVRFPLEDPDGPAGAALVARCRSDLARFGLCELDGLVRPAAVRRALAEVASVLDGAPPGDAAPAACGSSGLSVAADVPGGGVLGRIQHYPPLAGFLARVLGRPQLRAAESGLTLTRHASGESAGWRFDRAGFTVTLMLQAPEFGGNLEYVRDLRGAADPNPGGVVDLLSGRLPVSLERLMPGTLNVFRGGDTAHRVTQVAGDISRIVAEFAWTEAPAAVAAPGRRARRPAV